MKFFTRLYHILILILFINTTAYNQILSSDEVRNLAVEWMKGIKKHIKEDDLTIKEIKATKIKDEICFYSVNFESGGYVLINAEKDDHTVLGYSNTMYFNEELLSESERKWIECVRNSIVNMRNVKKGISLKSAKANLSLTSKIDDIRRSFLTTTISVPSLFETHQTSRWAYWSPYSVVFPNQDGLGICVPLSFAQIMKYYKFPAQGVGSHAGTDFSKEWFNYGIMPFKLTYCGNGTTNCNDGSFDVLPSVSNVNSREVSRLIYNCGIAVDMVWGDGTYGSPYTWMTAISQYFNYSSNWNYRDEVYISNNKETFKTELRNELNAGRPIFLAYYGTGWSHGHAVVIDGVENDNYFHFAAGYGGALDAYYYLFDYDADALHAQAPYYSYYRAVTGISPNCSATSTLNLSNTTVSIGTNNVYQANGQINLSNFIVDGNGTTGGRITIQSESEVNLNAGFEVKTGGEFFVTMQKCGIP